MSVKVPPRSIAKFQIKDTAASKQKARPLNDTF
jgi:hypothetical protein